MLKIYNTLTRQKEDFNPINPPKVSFYQCGPTVYWTQHIGNMRAMVMADLIRRGLQSLGFEVDFVRNYTDVGHLTGDNLGDADSGVDRMEKGAQREGLTPQEIADKYIKIFENDTHDLNILEPTHKPRATEYIPQMIEMIQKLLENGCAYETQNAVYFDITKASDYNKLNRQNLEENQQGAGSGDVQDSDKRNPADFALWFFRTGVHENALQYWESPFSSPDVENGEGFPGWHIECSAMTKAILGETIDIHMGGIEHIPVHHTNEIAQSECANGVEFVHYWIHNEHLNVNDGKMSKSEGTGYALSEIRDKGIDPLVLRYFFLQAHYRSKQNFTWEGLEASETAFNRLKALVASYKNKTEEATVSEELQKEVDGFNQQFKAALEDDFNTPQILALVWEIAKSNIPPFDKYQLILSFDKVLGLRLDKDTDKDKEIPENIQTLVKEREDARKAGDWGKSDELRDKIDRLGYSVNDIPEGTKISKK